jgi:hypothetical protein
MSHAKHSKLLKYKTDVFNPLKQGVHVRFEALTMVLLKIQDFWDVMPY